MSKSEMNAPSDDLRRRKIQGAGSDLPQNVSSVGLETDSSLPRPSSCQRCVYQVCSILLILLSIYLMISTSPIDPVVISLPPPPKFAGPLEPNTRLRRALVKFRGELRGPESLVFDPTGEYLYTGTADGKIMEIYGGKTREVARLGTPPCGKYEDEPTCGRPLGMKFDKNGLLIVLDAYLGIFQVNVVTGDVNRLLPASAIGSALLNDIDIDENGLIYFTDSSTVWGRRDNRYCFFEGKADGRLLQFNPVNNEVKTLVSNLSFANGVTLSYSKDFILVVELGRAKIHRLWLKGEKAGQKDIFADNIPGLPDNIRRSGRGTYWVGLAAVRTPSNMIDFLAPRPWLRKLITKFVGQETIIKVVPRYGMIIELDKEGKIIQSLQDPTGEVVPAVSEVEEHDGILYLGSYASPGLSIINLKQEFKHR